MAYIIQFFEKLCSALCLNPFPREESHMQIYSESTVQHVKFFLPESMGICCLYNVISICNITIFRGRAVALVPP